MKRQKEAVKIDVSDYIDELRSFAGESKDPDLYSLKRELADLSNSSRIFEDFERNAAVIGRDMLGEIHDFGSLIRIKNLASEIGGKSKINDKLHSLHFSINLLKNASDIKDVSPVKGAINAFLRNDETKIDAMVNELNDFKSKLDEIKEHHSNLLPKSLDNRLEIENRYNKHIGHLYSIHKRQKNALVSSIKLFLKLAKRHISSLKRFK